MNCHRIQPLLSEYLDNALSARDTWEVDRHLGDCRACAGLLNEMRRTVGALASAPRFEVSADFMDRLHARIAALEPEPPRRAWRAGLREMFRPRVLPLWGAAAATAALALVFLLPRGHHTDPARALPQDIRPLVQTARTQSVALSAADPFGDMAAANLAATGTAEAGAETDTAQ